MFEMPAAEMPKMIVRTPIVMTSSMRVIPRGKRRMLDAADNLIDRRNDRESKERDHDANHDDHERLKQCCGVTRCLVDFVFVELGKVAQHIAERSRFFANAKETQSNRWN